MRSCRLFSLLLTLTALCQTAKAQFLGGNGQGAGQVAGTTYRLLDGATVTPQAVFFAQSPSNTVVFRQDVSGSIYVNTHNDLLLGENTSVTLSIQNNPGGGSLIGTTNINCTAGVGSFSGLAITRSGTGYTLGAAGSSLSGNSQPFNVTNANLVIISQPPGSTYANESFDLQVGVADPANGSILTLANTTLNIAINNNPGSSTLSGTTSIQASSGVVRYSGLSLNNEGLGYTLQVSGTDVNSATTNGIDVLSSVAFNGGSGDGDDVNTIISLPAGGQKLWRGGISTAWATAGNWFPSGVPTSTDAISIETNSFTNIPVLDMNRTIASIDFGDAAKKIDIGTNHLTVTGGIFNASSNGYVRTASTGTLKRSIGTAEDFAFAVGNGAYNPVIITNNTTASDLFSVRVMDEVYTKGITGSVVSKPRVQRSWIIDKLIPSSNDGNGVDFSFTWNTGEATSGLNTPRLFHYDGNQWVKQTTGNTVNSANNLVYNSYKGSFSPFAIGDDIVVLPVTWLDFRCEATVEGPTYLQWRTAMEENTRAFIVERSAEGQSYETIAEVPAAGFSQTMRSYTFADKQPLPNGGYYRVKMEDLQGNYSYTDVCVSKNKNATNPSPLKVYPNPTQGALYIIALEPERNFVWEVFSATGQRVAEGRSKDGQANARLHHLSEGVYQLRVKGSGLSENHRILIRH